MAQRQDARIVISDLRGGRNGTDPPLALPMNQCTEALNVDWYEGMLGRARPGATSVSQTGGTAFANGIQSLFRHVPGISDDAAELWGVDGSVAACLVKRLTGGTTWADVTVNDNVQASPYAVEAATLNGKLYLAFNSNGTDRLHVWDPTLGSPRVRRVSINPGTNVPTMADTGAGAWAATLRYYRVRWWQIDSNNVVQRKSEATPSASFTPSGGGSATRVTKPANPGEGETHWSVEASSDNATWVGGGVLLVATTTFDDNFALTNTAAWLNPSEPAGYFGMWPSVRHLITDGNRLIGAGAWEVLGIGAVTSGGKNSRVWFSRVLGSADKGDAESVPNQQIQKNWVDLNENDGGGVTALMGPLSGTILAAKFRALHLLRPTSNNLEPYRVEKLSDWVGVVQGKAWCVGRDEVGLPAVYFYSTYGPYRYSERAGLQYLGRDNEDVWSTVNLSIVNTNVICWCLYVPDLHQVWFTVATGSSTDPDTRMVFDTHLGTPNALGEVRGGWAKHTGDGPASRCGCLFANTLGVTMSKDLKPYVGRSSGTTILKANTTDKTDNGTTYQSYATTRPILPDASLGQNYRVGESHLLGKVNATDTITVTAVRDFGLESRAGTTGLVAEGSETRTQKRVENTDFEGGGVFQYTIGDGSAVASNWVLDAVLAPVVRQEPR